MSKEGSSFNCQDKAPLSSEGFSRVLKKDKDISGVLGDLENISGLTLPSNKAERKRLTQNIMDASVTSPLTLYAGSCPDYSHENGLYTHKGLGDQVSLLSQVHIDKAAELLPVLDSHGVPFEYVVLTADVEATDPYFVQKFAGGSQEVFLEKCEQSRIRTQEVIDAGLSGFTHGQARSSSFFAEFGEDRFLGLQTEYQNVLEQKYSTDGSFHTRIVLDILSRMNMYEKMYKDIIKKLNGFELQEFLAIRTIRTMAQYLSLGRLIGQATQNPAIINHPTRNKGVYNERNKILLPSDGPQPQVTIPIFLLEQAVYE